MNQPLKQAKTDVLQSFCRFRGLKGLAFAFCCLLFQVLLTSCEEEVNLVFEHEPKLCLNCILNPDSVVKARLTLSHSLDHASAFTPVSDGVITLYEGESLFGILTPVGNGNYKLDKKPAEGKVYKITAEAINYNTISGETIIPLKPDIEYAFVETGRLSYDTTLVTYIMKVSINDRPGRDNYWITRNWVVHNRKYGGGVSQINAPFVDEFNRMIDTEALYGFTHSYGLRLSDEGFDGQKMEFDIPYFFDPTPTRYDVAVHFIRASDDYDKYLKTTIINLMKEHSDVPFFEPVQMHSNIENGYGIFGSCAVTSVKL